MISFLIAAGIVAGAAIVAHTFAPQGWRTRIANIFALVLVSGNELLGYLQTVPWDHAFEPKTALAITVLLGFMNLYFREITTTAPGEADA